MSSENNTNREALVGLIQAAVNGAIAGVFHNEKPTRSCLSCVHFNEAEEICLQFKQRPPARVIAHGCPAYVDVLEVPY
jgi:hypothetical protein